MSKKFSTSMFDELKTAMADQRSGGNFRDILKTEIGKNYIVRLVPNVGDIKKTIYHYYNHGWTSLATGQFISCVCPTTIGQRCPICEERVRLYRGDTQDKENAKLLGRKEQWLVNVYVIDDATNEDNNNNVKIIRYGKQLDKVIRDATEGIDKEEFGSRVFDLTKDGCNLRISVEKNDGGYPTYVSSKFLRESEIPGMDDKSIEETYSNLFDLEKVFEAKTTDEVKEILDIHFFQDTDTNTGNSDDEDLDDNTDEPDVSDSKTDKEEKSDDSEESNDEKDDGDQSVQDKLDDLMQDL